MHLHAVYGPAYNRPCPFCCTCREGHQTCVLAMIQARVLYNSWLCTEPSTVTAKRQPAFIQSSWKMAMWMPACLLQHLSRASGSMLK